MEDAQEIDGKSGELVAEKAPQEKHETRDEMLSRHRYALPQSNLDQNHHWLWLFDA